MNVFIVKLHIRNHSRASKRTIFVIVSTVTCDKDIFSLNEMKYMPLWELGLLWLSTLFTFPLIELQTWIKPGAFHAHTHIITCKIYAPYAHSFNCAFLIWHWYHQSTENALGSQSRCLLLRLMIDDDWLIDDWWFYYKI